MNLKNAFLRGTLLLTFAGLCSRIMGFFYRIFLANTIGAEGMGIYQLIFPVYSVCFSLCASGIETAVSSLTAASCATKKPSQAFSILKSALCLTLVLSLGCSFAIFRHADVLANVFLKEPRCEELLRILAVTIPFGTTQSCICGYYFGLHKAGVPSAAQLIEQISRILCVCLLYHVYQTNHAAVSPAIAVIGLVFGELCSLVFTITCFSSRSCEKQHTPFRNTFPFFREIGKLAAPLTVSRICINVLASLEATLIPTALRASGMDSASALSVYGILNGMALPFILFPNALTGSISVMLLPQVSEYQAGGQLTQLKQILKKTFSFCLLLGISCLLFFLLFGHFLGEFVFSSTLAGNFMTVLAWICPFLYLNTTLTSVLNGLGRTGITFFNGICGLFIRIGFIYLAVPRLGIHGYLFGLLASQLFVTCASAFALNIDFRKKSDYND